MATMAFSTERLLLVRMDRIGDLILTLPVDESLPNSETAWWIPRGLSFITQGATPQRNAREVGREISPSGFFYLLREVRKENYTAAIVFHAPWWVSLLLWLARIPLRGGVKSQWHSFLFLNRAIRQKRSQAEYSELEYNYRLVESIVGLKTGSLPRNTLRLTGLEDDARRKLLAAFSLKSGGYSVVHPGMGGSALNWPVENYEELIRTLLRTERIAITGTSADEPYLAPLRERLVGENGIVWLDGKLKGPELITILSAARTVIAPSTGVLHLSASTGQPTLGIFSPVRVQQPRRWGPQGAQTATLMPDVSCPGETRCLGDVCAYYPCMARVTTQQALSALAKLHGGKPV